MSMKEETLLQKKDAPTKVVIRHLPPSLTEEDFVQQISPIPDYDIIYLVKPDRSLGLGATSRAYINFVNPADVFIFQEKFDGYVFLDAKGNEYTAVVEYAPYQKAPKNKPRKPDSKKGTINEDKEFLKFVESQKEAEDTVPPSVASFLEEIILKEQERNSMAKQSTPLIEYIQRKKEERKILLNRSREEKRKKEEERRRMRDDERRRRRENERKKEEERKSKNVTVLKKPVHEDSGGRGRDSNKVQDKQKSYSKQGNVDDKRYGKSGRDRRETNIKDTYTDAKREKSTTGKSGDGRYDDKYGERKRGDKREGQGHMRDKVADKRREDHEKRAFEDKLKHKDGKTDEKVDIKKPAKSDDNKSKRADNKTDYNKKNETKSSEGKNESKSSMNKPDSKPSEVKGQSKPSEVKSESKSSEVKGDQSVSDKEQAASQRKLRYKDRPERAMYVPGQRRLDKQKEPADQK